MNWIFINARLIFLQWVCSLLTLIIPQLSIIKNIIDSIAKILSKYEMGQTDRQEGVVRLLQVLEIR